MANGGPQLKGLNVLVVAPPSERAHALTRHLGSMHSWRCEQIATGPEIGRALRDGTWDAVILEHDPSSADGGEALSSVIADAGQRPVIIVAADMAGSEVASLLRSGPADFAPIDRFDQVVAALDHALSADRHSRRRFIEAAAAAAVRKADQHMDSVFTEAPIGMALSSVTGTLIRVNRKLCEIDGRSESELVGSNFQTLVHPDDALNDQQQIIELLRGERSSYQVKKRYLGRNGGILWLDQSVSLARADDGSPLYFIAQFIDVTAQNEADLARDRALEAFAEAQEIARVGSWMWNAETGELEWSDEMKRIFGLSAHAGPPGSEEYFACIDDDDREAVIRAFRQVATGAGMLEVEYRITAADGARRILHALGRADPDSSGLVVGTAQDVTDLRAIERDVQAARERFQVAFEHAPVGMTISTAEGRVLQVNDTMCDITGYTRDELVATNLATITHPEELDERTQLHAQLVSGEIDSYIRDGRLLRANGEAVWVSRHVRILRDAEGNAMQMLTHFVDITERRTMERELRHMADHDPLTGLLNRRGLEAELERHVTHVNRYGDRGALLVLDLDHFKAVNDTLGHEAGDRLIVNVATLLRGRLRSSDAVARLGGDEFAILLPDATADVAEHVAAQIVADVHRGAAVEHGQTSRRVTASIGVTMFTQGQLNAESVLVDADLAMYDAKEAGRDRVAMHSGGLDDEQPRMKVRLEWIDRIRSALDHGQFTLYAQPVVELHTERVSQCELLLRMVDDSGDAIPPGAFLYIAERYDLIQELDEWVTRQAIEMVAREQAAGRQGSVEINVSAKSFANERLLEVIEAELARHEVSPERLIFEVTETAAISHMALARSFAERLNRLGCRFALDDFGAGYGGFFYLKHIPFDYLKIDREFVTGCLHNRTDQLVIESLVSFAHGLNKQTIAEGVEDHETELFLRRRGVDLAQGFHLGRPVPVADGSPLWVA